MHLGPTHHERFYWCDGSTNFLVDNTLYKLHMSLLEPHSIVLRDMFTMPAAASGSDESVWEGDSDERPIKIGAPFTVRKLDNLLIWFHRVDLTVLDVSALTDILELALFLQWDTARHFAIQALKDSGLTASHRLSLAISYRISDWIEPAFKDLMDTPPQTFTTEDSMLLGQHIMMLIMTTQAAIRHH
ncbi:hypothetical protein JB92DRAFT_3147091 [Gautieria morchelliformis]|nr:hypothetical protein JB92DRAFT_3147091 [Gautieria morchelliformis]